MSYSNMRPGIGRRGVLAGACGLLASPAVVGAQGHSGGVALVIGNSKYQWEAPLPNVRRDAPDMARRFQAFGLQTELVQDASRDAMARAIEKFMPTLSGASFAALYFAGHGAAYEDNQYLVPADADLSTPSAVKNLMSLSSIMSGMAKSPHRLVALDSCRNNPADGWRQRAAEESAQSRSAKTDRGQNEPADTLVLFSTAPGRVALDGPAGENSPFAAALLRQLDGQSVDLQALPAKLRRDLLIATEGRQVLWDRNTYTQPFLLTGKPGAKAAAPSAGGAGWSQESSRIIELNNAYAYARQSRLPMPLGLLAHRPSNNSPDAQKVGSFKFTSYNQDPGILLVMSVEEQQSAEVIVITTDKEKVGNWWFIHGAVSGSALEFQALDRTVRLVFNWRDANSGSVGIIAQGGGGNQRKMFNSTFTRLDG